MSITGYSATDTNIAVFNKSTNDLVTELKREDIITRVCISKKRDNKYSEIAVPFILNCSSFKLDFTISLRSIKQYLPARMNCGRVGLVFFEKSIKDNKAESDFFDWENMSGLKNVEKEEVIIGEHEIKATYFFKIKPTFLFSKNRSFLNVGLTVHNLLLKNLVYDLAVFSSYTQLSADNRPVLASGKDKLQKAFWWSEEIFQKKEPAIEAQQLEQQSDSEELDDVEELSLRAAREKEPSKRQLYELMKITRMSFAKMQKLVDSKGQIEDSAIALVVREQIEASAKLMEDPQKIIPPFLMTSRSYLSLSNSFLFELDLET